MSQIKVYQGYPLGDDRWVGITEDHQFVTVAGDDIHAVGGWGKHPLATIGGIEMMCVLLQADADWRSLTKAQQRCLMKPDTRTPVPWQTLTDRGLVDADGLRPRGWFLRLTHEWAEQRKDAA